MSIDIRLPQINAATEAGQLQQMKSYMYQLVEQLNWALATIDSSGSNSNNGSIVSSATGKPVSQKEAENTFNSIKGLIIKSADIVNAYYEEINTKLKGVYVAESDFGTYMEETERRVKETSSYAEEIYDNVQTIKSKVAEIESSTLETNAYIRRGLLYYDGERPVFGIEVGQEETVIDDEGNETKVFNKYARFTSDRLSFYDENDYEAAYVSDRKLYIDNVEVNISYTIGDLRDIVQGDGSVVTKYIGGVPDVGETDLNS